MCTCQSVANILVKFDISVLNRTLIAISAHYCTMRLGDLLNAAPYVEPQYVFPSDMTTGTSDEADASSFTSPTTPHSDVEPEQFPRFSNQSLNYRHQDEPDHSIDPSLRSDLQDVSSKKRKIEALTTYPEASTLSLSPHVHIEDRGRRFSTVRRVRAMLSSSSSGGTPPIF